MVEHGLYNAILNRDSPCLSCVLDFIVLLIWDTVTLVPCKGKEKRKQAANGLSFVSCVFLDIFTESLKSNLFKCLFYYNALISIVNDESFWVR